MQYCHVRIKYSNMLYCYKYLTNILLKPRKHLTSSQQQKFRCHSCWTCVTQPPTIYFARCGGIWMVTGTLNHIQDPHACWCNRSSLAEASTHSRQPLQSRNINCTIVLGLLLRLSSWWRLRYLLKSSKPLLKTLCMSWSPDLIFLGTCFKFWGCKIIFLNSVLSIIFYTLIAVISATLDSCVIKTAYGVVKMRFWF